MCVCFFCLVLCCCVDVCCVGLCVCCVLLVFVLLFLLLCCFVSKGVLLLCYSYDSLLRLLLQEQELKSKSDSYEPCLAWNSGWPSLS